MKWKIIPLILIAVLFFAASSSPATAQDDEEAEDAATVVELTGQPAASTLHKKSKPKLKLSW